MNKTNLFPLRRRALAAALASCFAASALALPTDPVVVNGTASFAQSGNALTVTNSNGAIIHWQTFNIGAGETTHFQQPSASSSVLNHVLSNNPSALYGTLSSNGQVWLVNPAGIVVGPGAVIDTAGFVASTLAVRAEDFLAGKLDFQATAGAGEVVNRGEIRTPSGGFVYLVGSNVANEGIIRTPNGEAILAAGSTVSLVDTGTPGVKVEITGAEGNATNLGQIVAEAGRIGIAGSLVRNSGTLDASSVVNEGGRIFLKASQDTYVDGNGRIVATGTTGGQIEILGNRVAVTDHAEIDASGANGGGTIRIGGDYLGGNPEIQNAWITYFGPNASLKANATEVGAGGTVIVWADDTTRAYGSIEAKGGPNGGNGGFVETSGKRYLDVNGVRVNTGSGLWLLDPAHITINDTGTPVNLTGTFTPAADNTPSSIGWDHIVTQLASTDVAITTTAYGGNIYFNLTSPKTFNSSHNLTLHADGDLNLSLNGYATTITNTGTGNFSFIANQNIYGNWYPGPNQPPSAGINITTGGNVYFSAQGLQGIHLGNGTITSSYNDTYAISLTALNGSIGIGQLRATAPDGTINVNAGYSIWDQNWTTPDAVNVYSAGGAITLTSAYGADPIATCTGGCAAISADTAGSPSAINATISNGATYGGIAIRHLGNAPGAVSLLDNSATADRNWVEFSASGNINLNSAANYSFHGNEILIEADGNLTLTNGGASFYGSGSELILVAGGNLSIAQGISAANIGLMAGMSSAARNDTDLDNLSFAQIIDRIYNGYYVPAVGSRLEVSSGTHITAGTLLGMGAAEIRLLSGSSVSGGSVYAYTNALNLNPLLGVSGAYVHASSNINLHFYGLASGGVTMDGIETLVSPPYDYYRSGMYIMVGYDQIPAVRDSTLFVRYGVTQNAVVAALLNEIAGSTQTPTSQIATPLITTTGTSSGPMDDPNLTTGGEPGTFGAAGEEEGEGQTAPAGNQADGEPAARRRVAQCS